MSENKHLESLYDVYIHSAQTLDKYCLFISSGAFSISFAFISDVVDIKCAYNKGLLVASWTCFIVVIFLSLFNHFISTVANLKAIKFANLQGTDFNKKIKGWNFTIQGLNFLVILGLLTGCILLVLFIHINL